MEKEILETSDETLVTIGVTRAALFLNCPAEVDVQSFVEQSRSGGRSVAFLPPLPEQPSQADDIAAVKVTARIAAAGGFLAD